MSLDQMIGAYLFGPFVVNINPCLTLKTEVELCIAVSTNEAPSIAAKICDHMSDLVIYFLPLRALSVSKVDLTLVTFLHRTK